MSTLCHEVVNIESVYFSTKHECNVVFATERIIEVHLVLPCPEIYPVSFLTVLRISFLSSSELISRNIFLIPVQFRVACKFCTEPEPSDRFIFSIHISTYAEMFCVALCYAGYSDRVNIIESIRVFFSLTAPCTAHILQEYGRFTVKHRTHDCPLRHSDILV